MESTLRFACLLAGLIAVQAQCPPSWVKVENSCYRAFGQLKTYDMASQSCKTFTGCDGISPGHLAAPTTFEERRAVRKIRFDLLRPIGGNRIGEGQRLRPSNVWMGFRLGQGANSSWDSTEQYDNLLLDQHWGPNRPNMPGQRPQAQAFDPTNFRWNGRCMTLPGQMQMNGAVQKWGHIACNMQAAYMCEISPAGTVNPNINTGGGQGGFNSSTGMGPGMPGGGRGGWGQGGQGQGGQGGRGGWGAGAGTGQGAGGGWGGQNPQNPGAGGGRWNPNQGAGAGAGAGGRWNPNQGAGAGAGAGGRWNPNQGAGAGAGAGGRWNPNQGAGAGGAGAGGWNPNQGAGAGRWNPQTPQNPGQGGRWNPQNPSRPRMYQQGQALAMP
ncbi:spicule matrix protein SM37 precursor [Strongylocentrotus purpuratus]|uniref:Spicule matrix protein n=1 Tax=Strongylocentrotus purpuratus TaxID=7668 RepID=O76450_STRPU|nr:spicule matrix protein SM37 precursor [Strongylocentrotus purpuratus]AAC33762.1 spicule matrix protein precursor [Strongylocentrotus purpuratus]|eukprot:NP_999776.1 spicule matrix protein SM37 precursor [Strongylocentrotus purpuratus]